MQSFVDLFFSALGAVLRLATTQVKKPGYTMIDPATLYQAIKPDYALDLAKPEDKRHYIPHFFV